MSKYKKLDETIKDGLSHYTQYDIEQETLPRTEQMYKKLLLTHINDPDLREIIGTEHNMKKLANKYRLEHHATIISETGEPIGQIHVTPGYGTTWDVIQTIKEEYPKGKYVSIQGLEYLHKKNEAINYRHSRDGKVQTINLTTTFRKS